MSLKPHPLNVPGDFYVEDTCCITCGVWEALNTDMIGWHHGSDGTHCFVRRQPITQRESDLMVEAAVMAEAACFHYRGEDMGILQRLVTLKDASVCESPIAQTLLPIVRRNIRLTLHASDTATAELLVTSLSSFLLGKNIPDATNGYEVLRPSPQQVAFRWHDGDFHRVDISRDHRRAHAFVAAITPRPGYHWAHLAATVLPWLEARAASIAWMTDDELLANGDGAPTFA